jgi:hypothetical protein
MFTEGRPAMEPVTTEPASRPDGGIELAVNAARKSQQHELAFRAHDGLEVTLLWHLETDELTVCVCDQRAGAYFEIRPKHHQALDAFYHPYSYASQSLVYFEDSRLAA